MNKNELVVKVWEAAKGKEVEISKGDTAKLVDVVLDSIIGALKSGEEVRLVGFGTFGVAERKASEGRNPRTGEKIQIPASKQPKFKAGKELRDALN
ncbi:MAG: HU family DNA-binding protein [Alphaproteobacteria bacterium]|nr:HU family DNA-binding protein [Alphaproteobacteria bacterium]TAD87741.1 MAG: HU family DNA-binding protein [Alphaproteobacteria bacterium]